MSKHLYSPHPRRFYITEDGMFGPGLQNLTSTEWNILSLFSRSLFSWDGMKAVPEAKRDGEFAEGIVEAAKGSIHQRVDKHSLGDLVTMLDPMELLMLFARQDTTIGHLEVVKYWGTTHNAMLIMEARALSWLSVQPRKTDGKVVSLRALSPDQQAFINKINPWMNGEIAVA